MRKTQPGIATRAMHEIQYVEKEISLQIILNWTIVCDQFQSQCFSAQHLLLRLPLARFSNSIFKTSLLLHLAFKSPFLVLHYFSI